MLDSLCPGRVRPRARVRSIARRWRIASAGIALVLTALVLAMPRAAVAQSVRGEASVSTANGYGRLVIRLAMEVEAQVRQSGGVLIIQFKQPVDVPVDRITVGATEY